MAIVAAQHHTVKRAGDVLGEVLTLGRRVHVGRGELLRELSARHNIHTHRDMFLFYFNFFSSVLIYAASGKREKNRSRRRVLYDLLLYAVATYNANERPAIANAN